MRTGSILLLAACLAFALSVVECQEANKRCKYFQWVRACKLSCKVLGHTTGQLIFFSQEAVQINRRRLKFRNLQKYFVIIEFLFLQNNCSDSNFNQKFDYEFSMQGLTFWTILGPLSYMGQFHQRSTYSFYACRS